MDPERENIEAWEEEWLAIPTDLGVWRDSGILSERQVRLWTLVLDARDVPFRTERSGTAWQLLVPVGYLNAARYELRLFEKENRNWPPPLPTARTLTENTLATMSVLIFLATFHNLTLLDISLPGHNQINWIDLGNAHAAKILAGQWWRPITALTLHSDWQHLLGNLAIGGVFIILLCRELGSGLAWSMLLCAGILGNLANACLQRPDHSSIGASTLVFGAVGILAALSMVRYRHYLQKRRLLPVAAAMALLALLGTEGEHTDLGAHLFGFVFGIGIGLVTEYLVGTYGRPGRWANALLALAGAVVVIAAWWGALVHFVL